MEQAPRARARAGKNPGKQRGAFVLQRPPPLFFRKPRSRPMHESHDPDSAAPLALGNLSSAYLAQLLDAVEQAVIATNAQGEIVFWNRCAERLYGWRADEVLGRDVLQVVPSEISRDQAAELMERL